MTLWVIFVLFFNESWRKIMKRTYQPSNRKRKNKHGFRERMKTKNGRTVLSRRRAKGRKKLTSSDEQTQLHLISDVEKFLSKIKSKNELEKIYGFGKVTFSSDKKVKANYIFTSRQLQPQLKFAVAVSSKSGNSVWRNRFKRLIRESIKLEIELIQDILLQGSENLSVIFSPGRITKENIFLKDIRPGVLDIIKSIKIF